MPHTWPDVEARLQASERIRAPLEPVATNGRSWMAVYRCRACGAAWAGERPYSERHGGGPEFLYRIDTADPVGWLRNARPVADDFRRAAEDRRFFEALGPELGPEPCGQAGCPRLRI
ncbi:MAG TPA: hypothetical protein VF488_01200, partial [Gemmatimonadaceae bacterium]